MGVAGLGVQHLLGIAVVRGHTEYVAGLLAGVVDGLDGLVGGSDGDNSGVIDTSVTDLYGKPQLQFCQLTMSGGAKLHMTKSYLSDLTVSATLSATP